MGRPDKWTALSIPALLLSIVPKIGCPLCWGMQVGWAGSMGLAYSALSKHVAPWLMMSLIAVSIIFAVKGVKRTPSSWLRGSVVCAMVLLGRQLHAPGWNIYPIVGVTAIGVLHLWRRRGAVPLEFAGVCGSAERDCPCDSQVERNK